MGLTMFCLTTECDFQFELSPASAICETCPKCGSWAFTSNKGFRSQHPIHSDETPCLICDMTEKMIALESRLQRAEAVVEMVQQMRTHDLDSEMVSGHFWTKWEQVKEALAAWELHS